MSKEEKFFGIVTTKFHDFTKLLMLDQYRLLVKKGIYTKGRESESYNFDLETICYSSDCVVALGKDFKLDGVSYTLNSHFIDAIFKAIMDSYEANAGKLISNQVEALKLKAETITNNHELLDFLTTTRKSVTTDYHGKIDSLSFQRLHNCKTQIELSKTLHSLTRYDTKTLSDFAFGMDNLQSSTIYSHLYSYERYHQIKVFCESYVEKVLIEEGEFEKIDSGKPSIPKSIAMLTLVGFFELEKIKILPAMKLYQIIAIAIGKDPNSTTDIRLIRGNYNVLKKSSTESSSNFTTFGHLKALEKLLKK